MKAKRVKLKSEPKSKSKSADKPSEVNYVLWLAAIVVVPFILFMPALSNEFTSWDDQEYIVKNSFKIGRAHV